MPSWLADVPAALTAIAFGPHKDLIELVLRVLASAHADIADSGLSSCSDEAASCLLVLLQHPVSAVPEHTRAALRKLLGAPAPADGEATTVGLLRLLSQQPVMRHLVVLSADKGTQGSCELVAEVMGHMLASRDPCVQAGARCNIADNLRNKVSVCFKQFFLFDFANPFRPSACTRAVLHMLLSDEGFLALCRNVTLAAMAGLSAQPLALWPRLCAIRQHAAP